MHRKKWVVNASPLIILAKVDQILLLKDLCEEMTMISFSHRRIYQPLADCISQFHPGIEKENNPNNPACPVKFEDHFTGVNPVFS